MRGYCFVYTVDSDNFFVPCPDLGVYLDYEKAFSRLVELTRPNFEDSVSDETIKVFCSNHLSYTEEIFEDINMLDIPFEGYYVLVCTEIFS